MFDMRLCFLVISELTTIKSHQHTSPNVNWTSSQLRYQTEWGKAHEVSTQHTEFETAEYKAGSGRGVLPMKEQAHQLLVQCQETSIKNVHASNFTWIDWLYLGICIYVHIIYICNNTWWKLTINLRKALEGEKGRKKCCKQNTIS